MVVDEIRKSDERGLTETFAFVVMPDHLHWLFALRSERTLGALVQGVKGRSSYRINRRRAAFSRIWQAGFHDRMIRRDDDLPEIGDYIIHNPVRAGLAQRPDQYPLWDLMWRRYCD